MAPPSASKTTTRPPLKILMLHGYTQSGPLFHAKSRALTKHIQKAFPLHEVIPVFPTAPLRLHPADIPGYTNPAGGDAGKQEDADIEAYAWFRRSNSNNPADSPLYLALDAGLAAVAAVLRAEGPFDGVIGFSQGAAMAAMVASLLEAGRKEAFSHFEQVASADGVGGIAFPASFDHEPPHGLSHPPFKFAICYSGFRAPGPRYRAFFENPPVQTPILHVLGSLDAVVEEARSRLLIDACMGDPEREARVVWHPGGHFLPSQRPYLDATVRFIREQMENSQNANKPAHGTAEDDDVRNMELPF